MKSATCRCGAINFISIDRKPVCGSCGAPLPEARRARRRSVWRKVAFVAALVAAVGIFALLPDPMLKSALAVAHSMRQLSPVAMVGIAGMALVILLAVLGTTRKPKGMVARKVPAVPAAPSGSNVQAKIEMLARKSWGGRIDIEGKALHLPYEKVDRLPQLEDIVKELLRHVRSVAPSLAIPLLTPRLVVEPSAIAAGQFIEQDGWVKISLSTNFFDNRPAAVSILCHEVCHYILEANGIREQPSLENERTTDVAMFIFGFGDLFMKGYKTNAGNSYRPGHRLGYLSDAEYAFAERYVDWLRTSESFLHTAKGQRDDWTWDRSLR